MTIQAQNWPQANSTSNFKKIKLAKYKIMLIATASGIAGPFVYINLGLEKDFN